MIVIQQFAPIVISMVLLAGASAFFSCSEAALFSLQADDRRRLRKGSVSQRAAVQLLDQPDRLLSAILFWNLLINIVFFAFASVIGIRLESEGKSAEAATTAAVALLGLIVFSEMLPKTIGVQQPHMMASVLGIPLAAAVKSLDRVMPMVNAINRGLQRTLFPRFSAEPYLELSDLEQAIDLSAGDEELAAQERFALQSIVLLSELRADELMRPRGQYPSSRSPIDLDRLDDASAQSGLVMVTEQHSDEIVAAIPLKHMPTVPRQRLENYQQAVVYMPWCATAASVLAELESENREAAVVVNELGETIGVVTLEDILETVFDADASRSARLLAVSSIKKVDEQSWHVTGITSLRRLGRHFGIALDSTKSTTVSGVLQEQLQRLPQPKDEICWSGMRLRVLEAAPDASLTIELRLELHTGPLP